MNTTELAKQLDGLARTLRGLAGEARETVAVELALVSHRDDSAKLTLGAINTAIAKAKKGAGPRAVQMRQDVFDRRVESLTDLYTKTLCGQARAHAAAAVGEKMVFRFSGRAADEMYYGDGVTFFDRTIISAQIYAWHRAARHALAHLVDAYQRSGLERVADREAGVVPIPNWTTADRATKDAHIDRTCIARRKCEHYAGALDAWVDQHTVLRYIKGTDGKVAVVISVDPEPFSKLLDAVAAGNADPIGIFPR